MNQVVDVLKVSNMSHLMLNLKVFFACRVSVGLMAKSLA